MGWVKEISHDFRVQILLSAWEVRCFVRVYGYRVMYGLEQEGESGYGPTIFQWFPAQFGYHGRNTAGPS